MKLERREILRKLMHSEGMRFNELWENEGESNRFAYHLKILVEDGLIEKKGEIYCLSHEGKKFSTYVEGKTGEKVKAPLPCVVIVVYNKEERKLLMCKRTKEPFYGYWGLSQARLSLINIFWKLLKQSYKRKLG